MHLLLRGLHCSCSYEAYFNLTFGTGKDENIVINLTEFVESKVCVGVDNKNHNNSGHAQQETAFRA